MARQVYRIGTIVAGIGSVLWAALGDLPAATFMWALAAYQFYRGWICTEDEN